MTRIYDRLLALTDEAITTLRTIQETQTESQRNAMASRAANDSIKAFYDSQRGAGPAKAGEAFIGDVSRADPRMRGRLVSVMLDECEDLEALEQAHDAHMKTREGLSLATQIARLTARAKSDAALLLREKAETVQSVGISSSTAAVVCWCAYLIDTTDEVPLTLREWLSGRAKS